MTNPFPPDDPHYAAWKWADEADTTGQGRLADEPPERDSWQPVDLGPYLRGEIQRPKPSVGIQRSDGLRFLYPGKEHAVIGEMEAGKSWFSLGCAAAELMLGNPVLYIHFEESDPSDSIERLQALGVPDSTIAALFAFVGPERQVTREALNGLLRRRPTLAVLDGVNEAMALHGWGIRDEDGAAAFRRHLVKPCTAAGAAVLSCDHVVKDQERRGRNALGSIHKGNGLSGSLILLENVQPFGRDQKGKSNVSITKDRPGYLRRHGRNSKVSGITHMGQMVVDDTRSHVHYLDLQLWAPSDGVAVPPAQRELAQQLLKAIQDHGEVSSLREMYALARDKGIKARNTEIQAALDDLVLADQVIKVGGSNRSHKYTASSASQDQPVECVP